MEEFRRAVVVATRLFVVATTYAVVQVTESVVGIDISHEAPTSATTRARGLLLTTSRQLLTFKLISVICVHNVC